ncbi:hypothetical protein LY56_03023 [Roseinatronobacter thiooxidans]|uniref:Uncharacterized protein n=1 Tax=Roseinatronobacter thiooxidans TaxID=121821 RepID=A0A2W7PWX4_9RHOB|nr:hypothetical protein LY56_03023 [Roseinatronobacter thiooxidans]
MNAIAKNIKGFIGTTPEIQLLCQLSEYGSFFKHQRQTSARRSIQ